MLRVNDLLGASRDYRIREGETLNELVGRCCPDQGFIVRVNGVWRLRADWDKPIHAGDRVDAFKAYGFLSGLVGKILKETGNLIEGVYHNTIGRHGIGGWFDSFVRDKIPEQPDYENPARVSPLLARNNRARLGGPIPVVYGRRTRMYPDIFAPPRLYVDDNETAGTADNKLFRETIFCAGQAGEVSRVFLDDSLIAEKVGDVWEPTDLIPDLSVNETEFLGVSDSDYFQKVLLEDVNLPAMEEGSEENIIGGDDGMEILLDESELGDDGGLSTDNRQNLKGVRSGEVGIFRKQLRVVMSVSGNDITGNIEINFRIRFFNGSREVASSLVSTLR